MFWLHRLNPANKFKEHFELAQALTPEQKDEVYRLRHHVYVDELGFERPSPDGRERDEFDEQSRHLLLRGVKTGIAAGCIRLVMVRPDRPQLPLPFEKIFSVAGELREVDSGALRGSIAEISRLALAREFRRRRRADAHDGFGTPAHPSYPYVQLGLYLGAIAHAPVEHRGQRVLSTADVVNPGRQLPFFMRPLYRIIELELAEELRPGTRRDGPIPAPEHLTGQIGPGHAGAHPSLSHRLLARGARRARVPRDVAN